MHAATPPPGASIINGHGLRRATDRAAPSGGSALFRGVALPARLDGHSRRRLHRQARHFLDCRSPRRCSSTKASASGADAAPSFPRASPPGWCSPISYFSRFDLWVLSRDLAAGAPNPALYSALLAAIHLMLFATLVRLLSARTQSRLRVPGGAGGHLHAGFGDSHRGNRLPRRAGIFLVLAVSTFVALEIRRSAEGRRLAAARAPARRWRSG